MSKVRKFQNAGVIPAQKKYKILIDNQEHEFTDDELDKAWNDEALKNILATGGIKEDDLNARYAQFKQQASEGVYNFDVTPGATLSVDYAGENANLGTAKKTRAVDKIFGIHNEGKQMNTVNYYLPVLLKNLANQKNLELQLNKLNEENKARIEKESSWDQTYKTLPKNYGLGILGYGEEYETALKNPNNFTTILKNYWSLNDEQRLTQLNSFGSKLESLLNLTPEQLEYYSKKDPEFKAKRDLFLKYYDPASKRFNFTSLQQAESEYSNLLESQMADKYLFDKNANLSAEQLAALETLKAAEIQKQQAEAELSNVHFPEQDGSEVNIQPNSSFLNNHTLQIPEERTAENTVLTKVIPGYQPGQPYNIHVLLDTDKNAVLVVRDPLNPGSVNIVNYDKLSQKPTIETMSLTDFNSNSSLQNALKYSNEINTNAQNLSNYLQNLDKNILPKSIEKKEEKKEGEKEKSKSGWVFDWENIFPFKDGGVLKAQNGIKVKISSELDKNLYLKKLQTLNPNYKPEDIPALYEKAKLSGKIIEELVSAPVVLKPPLGKTISTWRSANVGDIKENGLSNLSDVDIADLVTLGLDMVALTPTGPVAGIAGALSGLTGLYADVERDGFQGMDLVYAGLNVGIGALSAIPGVGALKLPKIAKNILRLKKVMPYVQTLFTGMGLVAAAQITKKIMDEGVENLTMEDMRLFGSALAGLRGAKTIVKKTSPFELLKTSKGQKVMPVEFDTPNGKIKHQILFDENEVAAMRLPTEGKTSTQVAKEIVLSKVLTDADLAKRVGNITDAQINIPTKIPALNRVKVMSKNYNKSEIDLQANGIVTRTPSESKTGIVAKAKQALYTGDTESQLVKTLQEPNLRSEVVSDKVNTFGRLDVKDGKIVVELGSSKPLVYDAKQLELVLSDNTKALNNLKRLNEVDVQAKKIEEVLPKLQTETVKGTDIKTAQKSVDELKAIKKLLEENKVKLLSRDPKTNSVLRVKSKQLDDLIASTEKVLAGMKPLITKTNTKPLPALGRGVPKKFTLETPKLPPLEELILRKSIFKDLPKEGKPPVFKKKGRKASKKETGGILKALWGAELLTDLMNFKYSKNTPSVSPQIVLPRNNSALGMSWEQEPKMVQNTVVLPTTNNTTLGFVNSNKTPGLNLESLYLNRGLKRKLNLETKTPFFNPAYDFVSFGAHSRKPLFANEPITINSLSKPSSVFKKPVLYDFGAHTVEETTNPGYVNSNKTGSLGKITIDPIWGLKLAEALNAIRSIRKQDLKINVPIIAPTEIAVPTVSENLLIESGYNNMLANLRTNVQDSADATINLLRRSQLEAKLRDFEAEGKLKGIMLRAQTKSMADSVNANNTVSRVQTANQNLAALAEKKNIERSNRNRANSLVAGVFGGFMGNKAQALEVDKQKNELVEDQLSQLILKLRMSSDPEIQKQKAIMDQIQANLDENGTFANPDDKIKYEEAQKAMDTIYRNYQEQYLKSKLVK